MVSRKSRHHQFVGKHGHYWNESPDTVTTRLKKVATRFAKRQMKAEGIIGDKYPFKWEWRLGSLFGTVMAFTRSEARSKIKKELGIKGRLPVGTLIRKVVFDGTA